VTDTVEDLVVDSTAELVSVVVATELVSVVVTAALEELPLPTPAQNSLVAGRTLPARLFSWFTSGVIHSMTRDIPVATSIPHFSRTQGVAAEVRASMFLQTHAKSVMAQLVVLLMASVMQGREQDGKMEMSWAEATAARAATVMAEYFILTVRCLKAGWT
jgi:hypothetical protein